MTSEADKAKYQTSIDHRKFEIDLFWRRSLFFWGIITSAFVGFAALKNTGSTYALPIADFGMVCSFAWSLVNRGSKYWHEFWELKSFEAERTITGRFIDLPAPKNMGEKDGFWFRPRRFSVTKLTMLLSDYVSLLWMGIVFTESLKTFQISIPFSEEISLAVFSGISIIVVICMFIFTRGNDSDEHICEEDSTN